MDSVLLQKQVRDNAQELSTFLQDINSWKEEMKRKESDIRSASGDQPYPPVRSKIKKVAKEQKSKTEKKLESTKEKTSKISGFDYASWDKFDVDKACEEINSEEGDSEEDGDLIGDVVKERQREEALYDKERGNEFVKKEKWKEAIQCYNRAIKNYPHDAIFYANRALCFLKIQDLRAAEADCTTALQLDSSYVKAYQRRAMARAGLGQFLEARVDLLKVMEIEPKNTASKAELIKIEKKLDIKSGKETIKPSSSSKVAAACTSSSKTKPTSTVKAEKTETEDDRLSKLQTEVKKADPDTSSNKNASEIELEKKTKCSTNQEIVERQNVESRSVNIKSQEQKLWPDEELVKLVQAIQKPPHLRSKKPLKRIEIEEIDDFSTQEHKSSSVTQQLINAGSTDTHGLKEESTVENITKKDSVTGEENSGQIPEHSNTRTQNKELLVPKNRVIPAENSASGNEIPPVPSTSVQFFVSWKKVKSHPQLSYQYLKQIPGADIPRLFRDSLESSTLSEIMSVIESCFIEDKEPVLPYIVGFTKVRRFSALVMFLSQSDKAGIRKILEYSKNQGECSEEEFANLSKTYEL